MLQSIAAFEFFALLACSLVSWGWLFARWHRSKRFPLANVQEPFHPIGLQDVFVLLVLWIGSQFFGQALFQFQYDFTIEQIGGGKLSADMTSILMSYVKSAELLAILIGLVYLGLRYGQKFWRRFTFQFKRNVGIGLAAAVLILPPILGVHSLVSQLVEYEHATLETISEQPTLFNLLAAWFTAVLVAPIAEETLSRGGIQTWIRRLRSGGGVRDVNALVHGGELPSVADSSTQSAAALKPSGEHAFSPMPWVAIMMTAGFFGFLHLGQGLAIVPLFLMAVALGFLYERTKSLIPCIVVHFVLNAHSMIWATVETTVTR